MVAFVISLIKWCFIVTVSLLLLGVLFERCTRWWLEQRAFEGKTFMEVNGKPLHYVKKGKGNCTVVFQSGMGSSYGIWQEIQDSLSRYAVTIAYDRNGLMLSETSGMPVTNDQVTEELQALLEKTNCPKPFILVGHSMAGIYLRPFIKRNAQHIAGIVFAEAAHPLMKEKASPELLQVLSVPPHWLIRLAVNTGIYRLVFSFIPLSPEIPFGHRLHQLEKDFFYRSCDKTLEELKNDAINFRDAERYTSFGNIPLTVMMGTSEVRYSGIKDTAVKNEYRLLVNELQHDLLRLSSNSYLVRAENSGHLVQMADAALLVSEIKKLLR